MQEEIRKLIEKYGIPGKDMYELPISRKRFPDGCHCRLEISGVETPSTLRALIDEMERRDVPIHRIISTVQGSTLLSNDEMEELARLAKEAKLEVIITPGPRRGWDLGAQYRTPEGKKCGGRIRGSDNLAYLIADIKRSINFGFRGFLVWDEGLLWLLNEMRKAGDIPKDVVLKVSVYAGHANPAGAKVLEMLGANTFNPVGDLTLPMLAAIREVVDIPLDIYAYVFSSFGGMNRFWESPEIARVVAPCYFKLEPGESEDAIYNPWTSEEFHAGFVRRKVRFAEIILDIIQRSYPEARVSGVGAKDLAVPSP